MQEKCTDMYPVRIFKKYVWILWTGEIFYLFVFSLSKMSGDPHIKDNSLREKIKSM